MSWHSQIAQVVVLTLISSLSQKVIEKWEANTELARCTINCCLLVLGSPRIKTWLNWVVLFRLYLNFDDITLTVLSYHGWCSSPIASEKRDPELEVPVTGASTSSCPWSNAQALRWPSRQGTPSCPEGRSLEHAGRCPL